MAKVSFDTAVSNARDNSGETPMVGFFSLKNDGDEAIVRIMHDSVDDFDILTTHPVTVGGKYRSVNCLREPRDPMDKCPLCAKGTKIQSRIFIHMIQYVTNEEGKIVPKAVVWERPITYATKLKNDIAEYGPLSECIFKIKRNGKAKDMNTTYDMRLGNPAMYSESSYPKVPGAFDGYNACGTVVLDKNFEELSTFAVTGEFSSTSNHNTGTSGADLIETDTPTSEVPTSVTPRGSWTGDPSPYQPGTVSGAPGRPTRFY